MCISHSARDGARVAAGRPCTSRARGHDVVGLRLERRAARRHGPAATARGGGLGVRQRARSDALRPRPSASGGARSAGARSPHGRWSSSARAARWSMTGGRVRAAARRRGQRAGYHRRGRRVQCRIPRGHCSATVADADLAPGNHVGGQFDARRSAGSMRLPRRAAPAGVGPPPAGGGVKLAIVGGGGVRVPLLVNGLVGRGLPVHGVALFDTGSTRGSR